MIWTMVCCKIKGEWISVNSCWPLVGGLRFGQRKKEWKEVKAIYRVSKGRELVSGLRNLCIAAVTSVVEGKMVGALRHCHDHGLHIWFEAALVAWSDKKMYCYDLTLVFFYNDMYI